jgi:hypothetical protein
MPLISASRVRALGAFQWQFDLQAYWDRLLRRVGVEAFLPEEDIYTLVAANTQKQADRFAP